MDVTFYSTIDHPQYGEIEVEVDAYVEPGSPGSRHEPPEGPCADIVGIRIESCLDMDPEKSDDHEGEEVTFGVVSRDDLESLEDAAIKAAGNQEAADYDAAMEHRYEEWAGK